MMKKNNKFCDNEATPVLRFIMGVISILIFMGVVSGTRAGLCCLDVLKSTFDYSILFISVGYLVLILRTLSQLCDDCGTLYVQTQKIRPLSKTISSRLMVNIVNYPFILIVQYGLVKTIWIWQFHGEIGVLYFLCVLGGVSADIVWNHWDKLIFK